MDLIAVAVLSVAMVPLALAAGGPLRIAVGLLFVLFLPGYVLLATIFPRKGVFGKLERVALSCGLSLATVPAIGLFLNFTPFGIKLESTLYSVLAFTLAGTAMALYRRRRVAPEERSDVKFRDTAARLLLSWRRLASWDRVLVVLLVMSVALTAGTLAFALTVQRIGERFTQFYVLGPGGEVANYPREITLGDSGKVVLGIVNREQERLQYRVDLAIPGESPREVGRVLLASEEKQEWNVSFTPAQAGPKQKVEFLLYKGEGGEVYHRLEILVDVKGRA